MDSITDLVRSLIEENPQKYGSDDGTKHLFTSILVILEKEEKDAIPTLTTVERVRRKFLADNPRFDYRVEDIKNRRAK